MAILAAPPLPNPAITPNDPRIRSFQNLSTSLNVSSTPNLNAVLDIKCSGSHFGLNPNIVDCGSAKETISPDITQHIFGQRHTGLGDDVFPLPFRTVGGMFCPIEVQWLGQQIANGKF